MENLGTAGRLVERLLYILSNYNFIREHKRSAEVTNFDYLTRVGCSGSPTPEDLEMDKDKRYYHLLYCNSTR